LPPRTAARRRLRAGRRATSSGPSSCPRPGRPPARTRTRCARAAAPTRPIVGAANAFLSHVYGDPFLELVEAAAAWEARLPADAAPVFYYLDLLVVNQHGQGAAVAEEVLWREFTGSVRAIGRTLVVLSLDAAERGPLTRV